MDFGINEDVCDHCGTGKTCVDIGLDFPSSLYALCLECIDIATAKLEKALEGKIGYTPTSYDR